MKSTPCVVGTGSAHLFSLLIMHIITGIGVPRSPNLFLIFINDFPDILPSRHHVRVFIQSLIKQQNGSAVIELLSIIPNQIR